MSARIDSFRSQRGYTLLDLLVIIFGGIGPAALVGSFFPGRWMIVMTGLLTPVFGVCCWCILFFWLVPAAKRRKGRKKMSDAEPDSTDREKA